MTKVHAQSPLFPAALIFVETPAQGRDKVWYANSFSDAVVCCVERAIQSRRGDEADELSNVDSLEQLKKIMGSDLRGLTVYTHSDFNDFHLDSFDEPVIRAAQALGWVEDTVDSEEDDE
jgi:hypothetical protein